MHDNRYAETSPNKKRNNSQCETSGIVDIEKGPLYDLDASGGAGISDQARSQHTHIVIPYPGHGRDNESKRDKVIGNDGNCRREVPIFCAICLGEYTISEKVSWSSNSDCPHVFHRKCIYQWFLTLLKSESREEVVPQTPTKLECPMCRQDFLDVGGEENV